MKRIRLTRGKYALVDDEDFDFLNQWKWHAIPSGKSNFYAERGEWNGKKVVSIRMHRVILNIPHGLLGDHIDGNGINNQRKNLRICTMGQNQRNRTKQSNNSSGYKGVYWDKRENKWKAEICFDYKRLWLGYFLTKDDARNAYIKAAKKYHGEFARI